MYSPKAQILLLVSIIATIAFVGCIFELSSGQPDWGIANTWAILGVSLPLSVVSFIVAVKIARESLS